MNFQQKKNILSLEFSKYWNNFIKEILRGKSFVLCFPKGNAALYFPVNTRRYLDVDSTSFERYGRQMDFKTTLCVYWV